MGEFHFKNTEDLRARKDEIIQALEETIRECAKEDMQWTTELPTEPGFYWMRELPAEEGCIVRVAPSGEFYFTGREYACRNVIPGTLWYGPLEPPG